MNSVNCFLCNRVYEGLNEEALWGSLERTPSMQLFLIHMIIINAWRVTLRVEMREMVVLELFSNCSH